MSQPTIIYRKGTNGYALYFYKGLWRESASIQNSQLDNEEENKHEQKLHLQSEE
jgi:hypothetical protein